jgi:rubrerythrin
MTTTQISSVEDLLAHAKAIESEAMEQYQELAEQMEVHHNDETAELFRKMVEVESLHVAKILERTEGVNLPHISPWNYKWADGKMPEVISSENTHYLMTPHHALKLALAAEQRALDFFSQVLEHSDEGSAIHDLAGELRDEEREHVELIANWLTKYPEPDEGWDEDPDPPVLQE